MTTTSSSESAAAGGLDDLPYPSGYPIGWFQIAWTAELPEGGVLPLKYFGQDLVLFRAASGQPVVLDAFCRHMGAHLGYGGRVTGDCIACPFHGWQWGPDGSNVSSVATTTGNGAKLESWPTREVGSFIYMWHHPDREPPSWEPPAFPEDGSDEFFPIYPAGCLQKHVQLTPQAVAENGADPQHVSVVHKWASVPEVLVSEPTDHVYRNTTRGVMRTPRGLTDVTYKNEVYGIGLAAALFTGVQDTFTLACPTPTDPEHSDLRLSVCVRRGPNDHGDEPVGVAAAIIQAEFNEIFGPSGDVVIWENMRYQPRPVLESHEHEVGVYRRWAAQFYNHTPDTSVDIGH